MHIKWTHKIALKHGLSLCTQHPTNKYSTMAKNRGKGKRKICPQKEPEDWCFECKDGGQLVICDHQLVLLFYLIFGIKTGCFVDNDDYFVCMVSLWLFVSGIVGRFITRTVLLLGRMTLLLAAEILGFVVSHWVCW